MPPSVQDTRDPLMERKLVRYDSTATDIRAALAATFGHMVELAAPVVTFYLGDLFYDARWLHEHAHGTTFTFLWSVDDTGTSIGTSPEALNRAHGYRITLALDARHRTWLTIEHAARAGHTTPPASSGTLSGILLDAPIPRTTTAPNTKPDAAPDRGAA